MLLLYPYVKIPAPQSLPNLHSTMLLLYQKTNMRFRTAQIDLHSTMLLLYRPFGKKDGYQFFIYIPLCFYFISPSSWAIRLMLTVFTFHYASTLSKTNMRFRTAQIDLHSTMLLLYRRAGWSTAGTGPGFTFHYASTLSDWRNHCLVIRKIYIPLCFYFIYGMETYI